MIFSLAGNRSTKGIISTILDRSKISNYPLSRRQHHRVGELSIDEAYASILFWSIEKNRVRKGFFFLFSQCFQQVSFCSFEQNCALRSSFANAVLSLQLRMIFPVFQVAFENGFSRQTTYVVFSIAYVLILGCNTVFFMPRVRLNPTHVKRDVERKDKKGKENEQFLLKRSGYFYLFINYFSA